MGIFKDMGIRTLKPNEALEIKIDAEWLDYMKEKVEGAGAQVIDQARFAKLFWIGEKDAINFGKKVNESLS